MKYFFGGLRLKDHSDPHRVQYSWEVFDLKYPLGFSWVFGLGPTGFVGSGKVGSNGSGWVVLEGSGWIGCNAWGQVRRVGLGPTGWVRSGWVRLCCVGLGLMGWVGLSLVGSNGSSGVRSR